MVWGALWVFWGGGAGRLPRPWRGRDQLVGGNERVGTGSTCINAHMGMGVGAAPPAGQNVAEPGRNRNNDVPGRAFGWAVWAPALLGSPPRIPGRRRISPAHRRQPTQISAC